MRVLKGQGYYQELIQSATWMGELFPALYNQSLANEIASEPSGTKRDCGTWSIANWIAFAGLAPYATLAGMLRNHGLLESGKLDARFRTVIRRGFFAYESRKFDLLKDTYRRAF